MSGSVVALEFLLLALCFSRLVSRRHCMHIHHDVDVVHNVQHSHYYEEPTLGRCRLVSFQLSLVVDKCTTLTDHLNSLRQRSLAVSYFPSVATRSF